MRNDLSSVCQAPASPMRNDLSSVCQAPASPMRNHAQQGQVDGIPYSPKQYIYPLFTALTHFPPLLPSSQPRDLRTFSGPQSVLPVYSWHLQQRRDLSRHVPRVPRQLLFQHVRLFRMPGMRRWHLHRWLCRLRVYILRARHLPGARRWSRTQYEHRKRGQWHRGPSCSWSHGFAPS